MKSSSTSEIVARLRVDLAVLAQTPVDHRTGALT